MVCSRTGFFFAFPSVAAAGGEEAGAFFLPDADGCDCDFIDPIVPSAWDSRACGLVGSLVGLGAFGMMSYKVPDWEYTRSRYWARLIACSSVTAPPMATSLAIMGNRGL